MTARLDGGWNESDVRKIIKTVSLLGVLTASLLGCAHRDNVVQDAGPEAMYEKRPSRDEGRQLRRRHHILFMALESRYPFSPETRQAQLDLIYLYYRSQQPESAIDAAEQFERENPTHPRVDYCLYMKGLVYFDQAPNMLEKIFKVDFVRPTAERHVEVVLDVSGPHSPLPE